MGNVWWLEISENECRKEFTMTERLRFAEKLQEIEAEKARKRMLAGVKNPVQNSTQGRTRKIVAEQSGIGSYDTLKKARCINDNQSLLSPEDFANWDHNKLSTNKAYQKIVAEVVSSMV